ncbi:glycosyltransferase family 4 protein [Moraxella ovis]|uniref:glycosyltransferase family 4 protein n=1 Tax=Moraxella ovis TaxID=29433 RepID=UPI000D8ECEE0|nr:glycosyltransferase [Moraxella ovis]SPX85146.1 D-inositol-3-phosphate glycosyltransferase [Moraxella ovis]STZ05156.1 D-inositol-3-phosphate glycosyltransferase [Moraxella ovis]
MIWINISNILFETKFSGLARTEYELCLYAYQLQQQGKTIGFCTFDDRMGFVIIENEKLRQTLENLKHGNYPKKTKPKFPEKFKRSVLKRINKIKFLFGIVNHCFNDNDTIIGVGQKLGNLEMRSFAFIKKRTDITLKVLCHDLIPINYPQYFFNANTQLFFEYIKEAIKVVDVFYCNSNFTKNELTDYYQKNNLPLAPMQVLTLGCDLRTKADNGNDDAFIQSLIHEPYLLLVSTIEIRKNHALIYEMYLKLLEKGIGNLPKVYFVGRQGWKVDELLHNLTTDERIKDKIVMLNNITDHQLIALFKHCWFTIYPSFIEGYGLPVTESLSMGKYCLASNAGALPEAGGDFIDYVSPHDVDAWCDKFLFLINNPDYIAQKEQHIKQHYKPVSWQNFAKQIFANELVN